MPRRIDDGGAGVHPRPREPEAASTAAFLARQGLLLPVAQALARTIDARATAQALYAEPVDPRLAEFAQLIEDVWGGVFPE